MFTANAGAEFLADHRKRRGVAALRVVAIAGIFPSPLHLHHLMHRHHVFVQVIHDPQRSADH
jgi:hypothetical protein